jgi:heme exporter protein CcmD
VSDFLAMSGYAAYVWPSIGLTLALLWLNIVQARNALERAKSEARRRLSGGDDA